MTTSRTLPALPASDLDLLLRDAIHYARDLDGQFDAIFGSWHQPREQRIMHILLHPRFDGSTNLASCPDCDDLLAAGH